MSILKISNVSKSIKSKTIIKNVNYTFESGNIYCLVGQNGSGKTTLLNIICNLTSFQGDVFFDGVNNNDIEEKLLHHICYVPQFSCLFERSTLEYNYNLCEKITNKPVEVLYNPKKKVSKLSGGQKKMSNLVRINDSYDIYLLDEPTTYLDKKNRAQFFQMIEDLKEKNKIVILISHDQKLIEFSNIVVDINQIQNLEEKFIGNDYVKVKKIKNKSKIKYEIIEFFSFLKENIFGLCLRGFFLTLLMTSLFIFAAFASKDKETVLNKYVKEHFSLTTLTPVNPLVNTIIEDFDSGLLRNGYLSISSFTASLQLGEDWNTDSDVATIMYDDSEKGIAISDFYAHILFNTVDETKIIGQEVILQDAGEKKLKITRIIKSNYLENKDDNTQFGKDIVKGCQFIIISDNYLVKKNIDSFSLFQDDFYVPKNYRLDPNIWTVNLISQEFGGAAGIKIGVGVISVISLLSLLSLAVEQYKMQNRKSRIFKLKVLGCDDVFIDKLSFYETVFIHTISYAVSFAMSCFLFKFLLQKITVEQLLESNIINFNYTYILTVGIIIIFYLGICVKRLIEKRWSRQ